MTLQATLVTDGPSDVVLVPILQWLMEQLTPERFEIRWADLRGFHERPRNLGEKLIAAVQEYPCQLLFVHRDAEGQDPRVRYEDIDGAAAVKDKKAEDDVRRATIAARDRTVDTLRSWGYSVIPSETNFFMVRTGRPVAEVRADFRRRGIAVGRPFPPMLDHLRVSVGTDEDMDRFTAAFKEIFAA